MRLSWYTRFSIVLKKIYRSGLNDAKVANIIYDEDKTTSMLYYNFSFDIILCTNLVFFGITLSIVYGVELYENNCRDTNL